MTRRMSSTDPTVVSRVLTPDEPWITIFLPGEDSPHAHYPKEGHHVKDWLCENFGVCMHGNPHCCCEIPHPPLKNKLQRQLDRIERKVNLLQMTQDDRFTQVDAALTDAGTALTGIAGDVSTLVQELADALANATMSPADSAALDGVLAHATAIRDAAVAQDASFPAP